MANLKIFEPKDWPEEDKEDTIHEVQKDFTDKVVTVHPYENDSGILLIVALSDGTGLRSVIYELERGS